MQAETSEKEQATVGNSNGDTKLPSAKDESSINETLETISKELPPSMISLEEQDANLNDYIEANQENPKKRRRKSSSSSSDSFCEGDLEDGEKKKKKQRLHWTSDLHKLFVSAVNQLGIENAAPKTIHQLMHQPFLTSEHIKSHLQKYRMSLKKQQQGVSESTPDYDGRRTSIDSLREEEDKISPNSLSIEGPRRMSIYDSEPTPNNLAFQNVPSNNIQPAPLPSMYQNNNWNRYPPSNMNTVNNSLNMNYQNQVYNNTYTNSDLIPNYQFPTPTPTYNQTTNHVNVNEIYPTNQNGDLINNHNTTSRAQSLLNSIPGLSMDSLGVVVDHIAKSDDTVFKLWTDAKLQTTQPEHYKYLMLGFRIGLYSGVKYDGAETTLENNNCTSQQQPQMEYPNSYTNMNVRTNTDPEMYKYMYPQF